MQLIVRQLPAGMNKAFGQVSIREKQVEIRTLNIIVNVSIADNLMLFD
jgi:hypothetical protein